MNKLIPLVLVCLLVVVAVPFVLGNEDEVREETRYEDEDGNEYREEVRIRSDGETRTRIRVINKDNVEEVRTEYRTRLEAGEDETEVRMELRERYRHVAPSTRASLGDDLDEYLTRTEIKRASEVRVEQRSVSRDRVQQLLRRSESAREEYRSTKVRYNDRLDEFKETRDRFRAECREEDDDSMNDSNSTDTNTTMNETDSADCDELRERVHQLARNSLVGALDSVIRYMEHLKARAEASNTLSEEEVTAIVERADGIIERAESLKADAEAATSGEDVAAVARQIGELMRDARSRAHKDATHTHGNQIFAHLKRAENLDARLQCTVEAGADIDLTTYQAHVAAARAALEDAKALYAEDDYEGAREQIALAEQELRAARAEWELLRAELEAQGYALEDCEVAVDEDEDIDDEAEDESDEEESSDDDSMDDDSMDDDSMDDDSMDDDSMDDDSMDDDSMDDDSMDDDSMDDDSDDDSTDTNTTVNASAEVNV